MLKEHSYTFLHKREDTHSKCTINVLEHWALPIPQNTSNSFIGQSNYSTEDVEYLDSKYKVNLVPIKLQLCSAEQNTIQKGLVSCSKKL
jgi:hypothetical protein